MLINPETVLTVDDRRVVVRDFVECGVGKRIGPIVAQYIRAPVDCEGVQSNQIADCGTKLVQVIADLGGIAAGGIDHEAIGGGVPEVGDRGTGEERFLEQGHPLTRRRIPVDEGDRPRVVGVAGEEPSRQLAIGRQRLELVRGDVGQGGGR